MRFALAFGALLAALLPCPLAGAAAPPGNAKTAAPSVDRGFDMPARTLVKTAPPASAYPNAGAIMLRDESTVHLNADGTYRTVVHQTVKIFNQRGRGYADVSIPYNASLQKITGIHARTIRPDGQVLPVKPGDIHETSPFSDYAMYDDARVLSFSMPGVEDEAILDYTYVETAFKAVLPGQFDEEWSFQDGQNPVLLSRLTLTAPASVTLRTLAHNAPGLKAVERTDGGTKTYVWEMRRLPEITPEPMMPPWPTVLAWMEISTLPSWQTVAQWYQHLAAARMADSPEIAATVKQLIAGKTTDTEKAKALYYWVEGKTRYVALELGLSAYQPHAAVDVLRNRYGDCKDMATLLIAMLHDAGIRTAWPVLLDAGNKLPVRDHLASPGAFDHAIVRAHIDGKPYWFDATAELCAFGDIPGGDRSADAFVIKDGAGEWEKIPAGGPEDNRNAVTTRVTLQPDGSAECETSVEMSGDAALGSRFGFRAIKPDQMKQSFESMVRGFSPNAALVSYQLSPVEDRDKPVMFRCAYRAPLWATKAGSLLLIPGRDSGGGPYDRPTRTFPLYSETSSLSISDTVITLPAGCTVEDKPADLHHKTPFGDYDTIYTLSGNTLTIHAVATIVPATVPASEYPALKADYEALVAQLKQPIVLRLAKK